MRVNVRLTAAIPLLLFLAAVPLLSQKSKSKPATAPSAATVARGKYLVEGAGLCADCHSPRNEKGEFVEGQALMGAPIMFKPTVPMPWAEQAPRLAGLPGWSDEAIIKFLMTGQTVTGVPPRPPMPPYRFNKADATAVVAYLRSMKPETATAQAEKK